MSKLADAIKELQRDEIIDQNVINWAARGDYKVIRRVIPHLEKRSHLPRRQTSNNIAKVKAAAEELVPV